MPGNVASPSLSVSGPKPRPAADPHPSSTVVPGDHVARQMSRALPILSLRRRVESDEGDGSHGCGLRSPATANTATVKPWSLSPTAKSVGNDRRCKGALDAFDCIRALETSRQARKEHDEKAVRDAGRARVGKVGTREPVASFHQWMTPEQYAAFERLEQEKGNDAEMFMDIYSRYERQSRYEGVW